MPCLAQITMHDPRFSETSVLTQRLSKFAEEMEALGLPWAAAHVRRVADMVTAERGLSEGFRS